MITPELDIFAVLIWVGTLQSLILAVYFFLKKDGNRLTYRLLAFILICFAMVLFDISSGYSGYIIYYIQLNNFSDPIVFFLGPLCFMYTKSQTDQKDRMQTSDYLHFIIPLLMLAYFTLYFAQPAGLKYNDFITAFHPDINITYVEPIFEPDPFGFLRNIVAMMIIHLSFYIFASIRQINNVLKHENSSFFSFTSSTLAPLRVLLSGFVFAIIVFALIKLVFYNDLGDHIIATYTSIIVYSITIYLTAKKYFNEEEI